MFCCKGRILCQMVVVLKIFSVLCHGFSNSSSPKPYQFNFGENVHMEHVLREFLANFPTRGARSETTASRRESRFVHYDTTDNAVNFGLEFTVPFLNIPVKKTVDTAMGFLQVIPRTSLNLNALFIAMLLALGLVVANSLIDKTSPPLHTLMRMAQKALGSASDSESAGESK